jgi:hypothetical protein
MPKPRKKKDAIDLHPDAGERFERSLKKIGKPRRKIAVKKGRRKDA